MLGLPFKEGWWQLLISQALQQFYEDFEAGLKPKLMINSPPQHGKSSITTDFICWVCGKNPRLKTIFASYSDNLGVRTNTNIQKTMLHPEWASIFPLTSMGTDKETKSKWRPKRNSELIEFNHFGGSFRNTTVGGKITGESLDLGVIDDVMKGQEEANSETAREKKWEWFKTDFFSRFAEEGAFIAIGTLWHMEDPLMRIKEHFPDMKVLSFPAIAEHDEVYRKKGEALFPEHKSLEFLLERKRLYRPDEWASIYQQDPMIPGGNKFKVEMLERIARPHEFDYMFITVDSSYKEDVKNDYTVFTLFGMIDGKLYVLDVWRQQVDAVEIESYLEGFLNKNYSYELRRLWIEPKGHGIYLNQKFKKHTKYGYLIPNEDEMKAFFKDRRVGKIERANNALPHLTDKKLYLVETISDLDSLTSELLKFPKDKHDDFVDTVVDGIKAAYSREETMFDVMARMNKRG